MTRPAYRIFVDGQGYAGESDATEDLPPGFHAGWTGDVPRQCAGIQFGAPITISGTRNLTSHMQRVLRRIGDSREITIRRIEPNE